MKQSFALLTSTRWILCIKTDIPACSQELVDDRRRHKNQSHEKQMNALCYNAPMCLL